MTLPFDLLIGAVPIVIGLVILIAGVVRWSAHRRRRREWITVPGQAVGIQRRGASMRGVDFDEGQSDYIVFTYVAPDGVERRMENPTPDTVNAPAFPFPIEVLVDPRNPARARIGTPRHDGGAIGPVLTGFGALIMIAGVVLWAIRTGAG